MKTTLACSAALAAAFCLGFFIFPSVPPSTRPPVRTLYSLVQVGPATGDWYGTGIVVREVGNDRLILTAKHVVETGAAPSPNWFVRHQSTDRVYPATIVRVSGKSDLALLYVSGCSLPAIPIAEHEPALFDSVWLFGTSAMGPNDRPFGAEGFWQGKESTGFNQHSAWGYPGQSGGALVNLAGELVGVCHGGVPGTPVNVSVPLADILAFLAE